MRDLRWAVIGRCWSPTPGNVFLALKNKRDWLEREVRRLEALAAAERDNVRTLQTVVGYFENEAAIADTHPKDGDVKQAPLVSGGGAGTAIAQPKETP